MQLQKNVNKLDRLRPKWEYFIRDCRSWQATVKFMHWLHCTHWAVNIQTVKFSLKKETHALRLLYNHHLLKTLQGLIRPGSRSPGSQQATGTMIPLVYVGSIVISSAGEYKSRNRHNVEWFLEGVLYFVCTVISTGQASLYQVQWDCRLGRVFE